MTTPKDARPATADSDTWAQTHTKAGELNAEGFRRGMQEHCQIGLVRIRLWLYSMAPPKGWGLELVPAYSVSRDGPLGRAHGKSAVENFSTLATARARYEELKRAAHDNMSANTDPTLPVYW